MDEKTGIQALDRTQPVLSLRGGKPQSWSYEYVRDGAQTMLAAIEIESDKATTLVNKTRKAEDFVTFMNQHVREYPGQRLCVVIDNLNTHKGKMSQEWLDTLVTFHYRPCTHSRKLVEFSAMFFLHSDTPRASAIRAPFKQRACQISQRLRE
jgi:transposase